MKLHCIGIKLINISLKPAKSSLICLILVFIIIPGRLFCDELHLKDKDINRFADSLYQNEEYYRAISEYKRLQYYFPASPFYFRASLQIGRAYMAGDRQEEAVRYLRLKLDSEDHTEAEASRLRLLLGISLLDLDNDSPFRLRKENIDAAAHQFSQATGEDYETKIVQDFLKDWQSRPEPDYKSPLAAGLMSAVLPGSGSFYTGRFIEGTYAFFLTCLFGLATSDAIYHKQNELGAALGLFTITFYGGGIYTAVNSAHKTNDKLDSDELYRLRKKHGIWFIPETTRQKGRF